MMRVAIIGCGQLARMLALSGIPLGVKFSFVNDSGPNADVRCVSGLGPIVDWHPGINGKQLFNDLEQPDIITFEKEQVTVSHFKSLSKYAKIAPSFQALSLIQFRQREKSLLDFLSIPTAKYGYTNIPNEFNSLLQRLGLPVVVKSVDQGYDGKNQWRITIEEDLNKIPHGVISNGVICEEWVPFTTEISLISVRSSDGEIKHYPITENSHRNGILVKSIAPAGGISIAIQAKVENYMERILNNLEYVGVMAMECFVTSTSVLVNELAPRVHNSGHWTQQGAVTSQFENHIRAITGMPLGSTESHGVAGMINVLGPSRPPRHLLSEESTLHWYDKDIKPGRKLGHVNFISQSRSQLVKTMDVFESGYESS